MRKINKSAFFEQICLTNNNNRESFVSEVDFFVTESGTMRGDKQKCILRIDLSDTACPSNQLATD